MLSIAHILEKTLQNGHQVNFKVRIVNRAGGPRGVYLRQKQEVAAKQTFSVEIDPIFATADNVDLETQMQRIEFEMKFELKTSSDFVTVPGLFMLMHNGRSFKFDVDPTKLSPGVHTANICGIDTTKPEAGPRFVIPITVVKPIDDEVSISLGELKVRTQCDKESCHYTYGFHNEISKTFPFDNTQNSLHQMK